MNIRPREKLRMALPKSLPPDDRRGGFSGIETWVFDLDNTLYPHHLNLWQQVDVRIRDYIVKVVFATRKPDDYKLDIKHFIQFGASPRATIYLTLAAKAWALLQGRDYVTPEDVTSIGPDVLRHRIIVTYEAEAQGVTTDSIIKKVFNAVPVP